jgi:hypothetical protein
MASRARRYPRRSEVNPAIERRLLTGETAGLPFEVYPPSASVGVLWAQHGAGVLEAFIENNPGRRPWAWWACDAPEPRRRLSGVGTPCFEVLAHAEAYAFGVPLDWVKPWMVLYYTGRAADVHGRPIGTEYVGKDFAGVAIDPNDPPRYEAEAVYLDRHGLLTAGERAQLTSADFEPEIVLPAEEDR